MNVARQVAAKLMARTGEQFSLDMHAVDIMPLIWKLVESYEKELNHLYSSDDKTALKPHVEEKHGYSS